MRLLRKRKSCNSTADIYIASPCDGEVLPLQESKDPMFRDAVLGQGCFVYPKNSIDFSVSFYNYHEPSIYPCL